MTVRRSRIKRKQQQKQNKGDSELSKKQQRQLSEADLKKLNLSVNGKKYVEIDHLEETEMKDTSKYKFGQLRFVVMSMIDPDHIEKATEMKHGIMKVWGGFRESELQKARQYCTELRNNYPYYNFFLTEGGKWMPIHPTPEQIEDEQYREKEMNELVKAMKNKKDDEDEEHKARLEQVKKDVKQTTLKQLKETDPKAYETKMRLLNKLKNKKEGETETIDENVNVEEDNVVEEENTATLGELKKMTEEQEKEAEAERKRLLEDRQKVDKEKKDVESIADKLKKIKQLYKENKEGKSKSDEKTQAK